MQIESKNVGQNLRRLRRQKEVRVVDLAAVLGVTRQHIYALEAGRRALTLKRVAQLVNFLRVDISELIGKNGKRRAS